MPALPSWINGTESVPTLAEFDTTQGQGPPINIDKITGTAYYVIGGVVVPISSGIYVNVKLFGAKGDGITDDTVAIQAAINFLNTHGFGTLFFPAGIYIISAYLTTLISIIFRGVNNKASILRSNHAGGGGANAFENLRNGCSLASIQPINSSVGVNIVIEDFGIENTNAANQGAGFFDRGGTFVTLIRARMQGHRFGGCYSQTELLTRINSRFEGQVNLGAGEWMINGNDLGDGANSSFTNNQLSIGCQYNQNATIMGLIHDGGYNYTSINDNFNGGDNALILAGINNFTIINMAAESTVETPVLFDSVSYYGGAGVGPCSGSFRSGGISAPSGAFGCVKFISAGSISFGDGMVLSTPQSTIGASLQGCANAAALEIGIIGVPYSASTDTIQDNYPTLQLQPSYYAAVAPAGGYYKKGSIVYNNGPNAYDIIGWRTNVAGNPGTVETIPFPNFIAVGAQLLFDDASGATYQGYLQHDAVAPVRYTTIVSKGGLGTWQGGIRLQLNYNAGALFDAFSVVADTTGTTASGTIAGTFTATAFYSGVNKVVGAQGAAVADSAAFTSVNATNAVAAPTKAEFDAFVAEFNKLRTDTLAIRTQLNLWLARARTATGHGLIA